MAYTPDWEAIADALKRVMATGTTEDEAKTDLCRALADRKIDIRVRTPRAVTEGNARSFLTATSACLRI